MESKGNKIILKVISTILFGVVIFEILVIISDMMNNDSFTKKMIDLYPF